MPSSPERRTPRMIRWWSSRTRKARRWISVAAAVIVLAAAVHILRTLGLIEDPQQSPTADTEQDDRSEQTQQDRADEPDGDGVDEDEQAFLDALGESASERGSGIRGFGDEDNLELGYAVCADLEDGAAPAEVVQSLKQPDGGPVSDVASELVGHAQTYLCE